MKNNIYIPCSNVTATSFSAEVLDYVARVQANGGSVSNTTLGYLDTFVVFLKSVGVWSFVDDIGVFVGDYAASAVKLKYATTSVMTYNNMSSADYSEATGISGNGSDKWIDTGYSASNFVYSDLSICLYTRNSGNPGSEAFGVLGSGGGSGRCLMNLGYVNGSFYMNIGNGDGPQFSQTPTYGFYTITSTGTSGAVYRNVTVRANITTSAILGTGNIIVLRGPNGYAATTVALYIVGKYMTEDKIAYLYSAVQRLQTSLGRQIF